jgi:NAD+ synthase
VGAKQVLGLILPERESSGQSTERGRSLAAHLGIAHEECDITAALEALGCYRQRDEAIRRVFPIYGVGWKNKIVIAGGTEGGINFLRLVVASTIGERYEEKCRCASISRSGRRQSSSSACESRWITFTLIG